MLFYGGTFGQFSMFLSKTIENLTNKYGIEKKMNIYTYKYSTYIF